MTQTVGVDIEVTPEGEVWCVGVADGESRTAFRDTQEALDYIGDRTPVLHNAGFDLSYIDVDGTRFGTDFRDTLTEAHLKGYAPKNLPDLTATFLTGSALDKTFVKESRKKGKEKVTFDQRPQETLEGCSLDAWASWALHQKWESSLRQYDGIMEKERQITRILMDMKRTGMPVSQRKLTLARRTVIGRMAELEGHLDRAGLCPTDAGQIAQWFWRGKTNPQTTPTGQLSTAKDILRDYATEEQKETVEWVIEWRQLDKYNSTYIDGWEGQERIHANLNQTGAATWRFSCSNP